MAHWYSTNSSLQLFIVMKRILVVLVIIVVGCMIGYIYYYGQITTAYYRVSLYPPTLYDNKPKVEIQKTPQYENDSLAIAAEEYIYQYMQEQWEKEREESMKQNHGNEDPVLRRFRDEQRIIIKLAHKRSFEVDKLKELITKYGLRSYEVESCCKENEVEMSIYPLLSKY